MFVISVVMRGNYSCRFSTSSALPAVIACFGIVFSRKNKKSFASAKLLDNEKFSLLFSSAVYCQTQCNRPQNHSPFRWFGDGDYVVQIAVLNYPVAARQF